MPLKKIKNVRYGPELLVGLIVLGAIFFFFRKKNESAPSIQNSPTTTVAMPLPLANSPLETSKSLVLDKKKDVVLGDEDLVPKVESPLCRHEKEDVIFIPSLFLRGFYEMKINWILIPKDYATCFTENKRANFYFSHFDAGYQIPFFSLVKMEARVSSLRDYNGFETFKEENKSVVVPLPNSLKSKSFWQALSATLHSEDGNWVQVFFDVSSIEPLPSYKGTPEIHPFAKLIDKNKLDELVLKKNTVLVDIRSRQAVKKNPSLQNSKYFAAPNKLWSNTPLPITKLEVKSAAGSKILGINKNRRVIIYTESEHNFNAHNLANLFVINQYKNLFILKNGLNGTLNLNIDPGRAGGNFKTVNAFELRSGIQDGSMVPLDARLPFLSIMRSIPRSISINKMQSKDDRISKKLNTDFFNKYFDLTEANRFKDKLVVIYGRFYDDPFQWQGAKWLTEQGFKVAVLEKGFREWSFASEFYPEVELVKGSRKKALAANKRTVAKSKSVKAPLLDGRKYMKGTVVPPTSIGTEQKPPSSAVKKINKNAMKYWGRKKPAIKKENN